VTWTISSHSCTCSTTSPTPGGNNSCGSKVHPMGGPAIRQAGVFYRVSPGSRNLRRQILTSVSRCDESLGPTSSGSPLQDCELAARNSFQNHHPWPPVETTSAATGDYPLAIDSGPCRSCSVSRWQSVSAHARRTRVAGGSPRSCAPIPRRGQPADRPWRLALITMFQFVEDLSDRQAADAVRARIDWKYALGLNLDNPGFDHRVLSEFRSRLIDGGA
jgi:Transposase domain (DUF772)